jgi:glycosyltransferase involved in cell wall biosynthesis
LSSSKPKLVVLLSRFPFPLEKGDKLRAYYQIKELSADFSIFLIAISDTKVAASSIEKLEIFCTEIHIIKRTKWSIFANLLSGIFTSTPFQIHYFYSLRGKWKTQKLLQKIKPDHIYCQLIRTAEYVKDYHLCPKTMDYMDAFSKGMERRIEKSPWYIKWLFILETKRLKAYERTIFDYFEHKVIISAQDREFISHPEKASITCVPNGIDASFFESPQLEQTFDLVFIGNLNYAPNMEAVAYISNEILSGSSSLTCLVSGANPNATVQRICKNNPQITLQGWVEDIRYAYRRGKIFIAPMLIGTGMQNKLLEAMALGIPCVTTDLANNGIHAVDQESVLVANTKEEFILAIHSLLENSELYAKIANNGKAFVQKNYSWKKANASLKNLLLSQKKI